MQSLMPVHDNEHKFIEEGLQHIKNIQYLKDKRSINPLKIKFTLLNL